MDKNCIDVFVFVSLFSLELQKVEIFFLGRFLIPTGNDDVDVWLFL